MDCDRAGAAKLEHLIAIAELVSFHLAFARPARPSDGAWQRERCVRRGECNSFVIVVISGRIELVSVGLARHRSASPIRTRPYCLSGWMKRLQYFSRRGTIRAESDGISYVISANTVIAPPAAEVLHKAMPALCSGSTFAIDRP